MAMSPKQDWVWGSAGTETQTSCSHHTIVLIKFKGHRSQQRKGMVLTRECSVSDSGLLYGESLGSLTGRWEILEVPPGNVTLKSPMITLHSYLYRCKHSFGVATWLVSTTLAPHRAPCPSWPVRRTYITMTSRCLPYSLFSTIHDRPGQLNRYQINSYNGDKWQRKSNGDLT